MGNGVSLSNFRSNMPMQENYTTDFHLGAILLFIYY